MPHLHTIWLAENILQWTQSTHQGAIAIQNIELQYLYKYQQCSQHKLCLAFSKKKLCLA